MEAASETTTDQEDQTKDRESGGDKELTKRTGKAQILHVTLHMDGSQQLLFGLVFFILFELEFLEIYYFMAF